MDHAYVALEIDPSDGGRAPPRDDDDETRRRNGMRLSPRHGPLTIADDAAVVEADKKSVRRLIRLVNRNSRLFHTMMTTTTMTTTTMNDCLVRLRQAYHGHCATAGRPNLRAAQYGPYLRHRLLEELWLLERPRFVDRWDEARTDHYRIRNLITILDAGHAQRFTHELMRSAIRLGMSRHTALDVKRLLVDLLDEHDDRLFEYEGLLEYHDAIELVFCHYQAYARDTLLKALRRHRVPCLQTGRRPAPRLHLCWSERARAQIWCSDHRVVISFTVTVVVFICNFLAYHYWKAKLHRCGPDFQP